MNNKTLVREFFKGFSPKSQTALRIEGNELYSYGEVIARRETDSAGWVVDVQLVEPRRTSMTTKKHINLVKQDMCLITHQSLPAG
jgi:hypothetical protein